MPSLFDMLSIDERRRLLVLRADVQEAYSRAGEQGALETAIDRLRILQGASDASAVACKDGCAYCCLQPVYVTMTEAQSIAKHLREQKRDRAAVKKIRENRKPIQRHKLPQLIKETHPCPFLEGDAASGRCTIYEARPLACRSFTSDTVDTCIAATNAEDPDTVANPSRPRDLVFTSAARAVIAQRRLEQYELRAAMLHVLAGQTWKSLRPIKAPIITG